MLNDIVLAFAISPDEPMVCDEVAKVIGEEDYNYVEYRMRELVLNDGPLVRLHELEGGYGLYKINPENKDAKLTLELVKMWTNN